MTTVIIIASNYLGDVILIQSCATGHGVHPVWNCPLVSSAVKFVRTCENSQMPKPCAVSLFVGTATGQQLRLRSFLAALC